MPINTLLIRPAGFSSTIHAYVLIRKLVQNGRITSTSSGTRQRDEARAMNNAAGYASNRAAPVAIVAIRTEVHSTPM